MARSTWLVALALGAAACGGETRTDEIQCPAGTVRAGRLCVSTDGGLPDAGAGDDAAVTPDGAQPGDDGAVPDAAEGDGGAPDAGTPDTGPVDSGEPPQAVVSETSVDFGRVVVGARAQVAVIVSNPSTETVRVGVGLVSGPAAADFSVTSSEPVGPRGVELGGGASVTFTFTFEPSGLGVREGALSLELCDGGCAALLPLRGEGLADAITCAPSSIDFGQVSPGVCLSDFVACTNTSDWDATIASASIAAASSPAFALVPALPFPLTVPAGGSELFEIEYCPTVFGVDLGDLELVAVHPDPLGGRATITLTGEGGGPDLACAPTSLDFGPLGLGRTRQLDVTCSNVGTSTLAIAEALFTGTSGAFVVQGGAMTLGAGASATYTVDFSPVAAGAVVDTLVVRSNDRDTPEYSIGVAGEALAPNGCTLTAAPATFDVGGVFVGTTARAAVLLTNTGTGLCDLELVGLSQGTGAGLALFTAPGTTSLAAGASVAIELDFTPAAAGAVGGGVELRTTDLDQPWPWTLVITAEGVDPATYPLTVTPPFVDFGAAQPGCSNPIVRNVRVTNRGATPRTIAASIVAGSSSAFTTSAASVVVPASASIDVPVTFQPATLGAHTGGLRIAPQGAAPLTVPLSGTAAASPRTVQTFTTPPQRAIDLLLVVDDSGSMAEEQAALAQTAATLLAVADASGADYHIGVTTTDPGGNGAPPAGSLRGTPAIITAASATRVSDLQSAIDRGTNGSAVEQGLFGTAQAVTNPVLLNGTNAGFLRANAELVVLVLSDEEDQSPDSVASYVSQLRTRPIGLAGEVRVYSISGGPTGCSGVGGSAQAGLRYIEAATLTGGFDRSICDVNYTQTITEIATAVFESSGRVFPFASTPAPGSIEVFVDNVAIPARTGTVAAWGADYVDGNLVFSETGAPAPTSTVRIEYSPICISATCGDGVVALPEQCDDGNTVDGDACPSTCYAATCGDGFLSSSFATEQCDDANTIDGDGCNGTCVIEGCGNSLVETGEGCDDGPANSDSAPDACRTTCEPAACHDGVVDTGEACDDGNTSNTDACVGSCVNATCGDGFVLAPTEQCDDGNAIDNDGCSNACTLNIASFTVTSVPATPLVPTAGTAITWSGSADDGFGTVAVGFPFSFLGTAVTNVYPSTNGLVAFVTASTSFTNQSMPNAAIPNGLIAWWWDDLHMGLTPPLNASATTALVGTAPNRIRVLTFLNVPRYGSTPGATTVNAEVRLYEGTNVIEVHYGTASAGPTFFSASAGWENPTGTAGANVLGCTTSCATPNWPTNTIYRYTP
ncbi:choice-of-anchor D domain-containing protein [Myxococcota bacterium]|nr:choice-of-anchor D domain-containing protein [Myxococcota bacterium]